MEGNLKLTDLGRWFFGRAIQAWHAGGLLPRVLAVYALFAPPLLALSIGLGVSHWISLGLLIIGNLNTMVFIPAILWWRSFGGRERWHQQARDPPA